MDGSASIGESDFEQIKSWVANLVNTFDIGTVHTRVGVIVYADQPKLAISLNNYYDKSVLIETIQSLAYEPGNTLTGASILYALDTAFTPLHGARGDEEGVEKILIVVTDGRAQDNVAEAASRAEREGIRVYALGIGPGTLKFELEQIASDPIERHVFQVLTLLH